MSFRIVCAPTYPLLLEKLLEDVRKTARETPLLSCWVLVPTSSLAARLRVQVSRRVEQSRPLGGVRILSLSRMLNRIAATVFGTPAPRWSLQLDLLLYEMIGRLPESSPLGRIRAGGCGLAALKRTLLDLAEGGVGTEEADLLRDVIRSEPLEEAERELLRFYLAWLEVLETPGYEWQPRQARELSRWIESAPVEQVHAAVGSRPADAWPLRLYGFYDLTDSNLQVIAALSSRLGVQIYLPFARRNRETHPGYTFTASVLEDLCFRMQTEVVKCGAVPTGVRTESIESVGPSPHGDETFDRETVGLFSARDPRPETRDHFKTKTPPTAGSARSSGSEIASVFLDSFPEGEIPEAPPPRLTFQFASGLRAEMISAAVRVKRWIDEGCPPEEILVIAPDVGKYYSAARELFELFGIPLRVLDLPAARTGTGRIVALIERLWWDGGTPEWVLSMLRDLARMLEVESSEAGGLARIKFTNPEKELIRCIAEQCGSPPSRMMTPSEAIHRLSEIPGWLVESGELLPLIKRLEEVRRLRGDVEFPWEILRTAFRELFENTVSDSLNRSGVILGSLMRIRGMTARCAVLLGLSGTEFLSGIEEDPLLADAARERILRLVGELGHRLPLKARSGEEMTLLFLLLNTCAESLHWVVPETDEQGKSTAPAPFILRYLNAWKRDDLLPCHEHRIARSPADQASLLLSLDSREGRFIPPEFLQLIPEFNSSLRFSESPKPHPGSEYKGLPTRLPTPSREEYSVTDLEILARCPFRFWAEKILRVDPLESLEFDCGIDSTAWGTLVHRFLEKLLRPVIGRSITGAAGDARVASPERIRSLITYSLNEKLPGWRLMPEFKQADLRRRLESLAEAVLNEETGGDGSTVVTRLEYRVARPFPSLSGARLKGVIDRIDRARDEVRIVDYKSGRSPSSKAELKREVHALFRLQPLLYPWLVDDREEMSPARFQFLFLGEDPPKRSTVDSDHDPETVLEVLGAVVQGGEYPPTSNEDYSRADLSRFQPCRWCRMAALCRRNDPGRPPLEQPWEFSPKRYRLLEKLMEPPNGRGNK